MNIGEIAKSVQTSVVKHSPEILVGLGISGMIATTVLAVRATPKALQLLEEKAIEEECEVEDLTAGEKIKTCWKCYIPAAISGVTSAACIIGAHSVNARRNAALAAAYTLSDTALREYRDKVVETIGEKKEKVVREKIAEDRVKNTPVNDSQVIVTGNGTTRCLDYHAGRYFDSDIEKIKKAVNELNKQLLDEGYVSLNDLYDCLNLEHTKMGYDLGWNLDDGLVDIDFSSSLASDGVPCLVMDYRVAPRREFYKFRR